MSQGKKCIYCGKQVIGRSDKRFCSDACRSAHNNHLKTNDRIVRTINNYLLHNRRILQTFLPGDQKTITVNREALKKKGFRFNYLTHTYINPEKKTYRYCYDHGYLALENDWFLIVRER